jgi:hypothetical protein
LQSAAQKKEPAGCWGTEPAEGSVREREEKRKEREKEKGGGEERLSVVGPCVGWQRSGWEERREEESPAALAVVR